MLAGNCHYWEWWLIWQMQTTCHFFYGTNWSPAANSVQRDPWSYQNLTPVKINQLSSLTISMSFVFDKLHTNLLGVLNITSSGEKSIWKDFFIRSAKSEMQTPDRGCGGFTKCFSNGIHIQWKFHSVMVPLACRSLHTCAPLTTAQLSCHVKNFVL